VIAVGGLLAALLLVASEFTTLFTVRFIGSTAPFRSVATGSHHDYALLPIALLAAMLAVASRRGGGRPALLAIAALAVLTLVIALLIDLPDANRTGLVAAGAHYELGSSSPTVGFYLETLGAVLLLIASGVGVLAGAGEARVRPPRPPSPVR
jgi:hypothetical protein